MICSGGQLVKQTISTLMTRTTKGRARYMGGLEEPTPMLGLLLHLVDQSEEHITNCR